MTFQSKYGFHPCDYQTYRKLKRLHKTYFQAKRKIAEWERWNNKQPQNRVIKRKVPGSGYEILGPKSEPVVPKVYREIVKSNIIVEYQRARHGVPKEEMVRPMGMALHHINQWIAALDEFENKLAA